MFIHGIYTAQPASKNARDLSEELVDVIRAARKKNKNLSAAEVCQATRLAQFKLREELGGMANKAQIAMVIGILISLLIGALAFANMYR